MVSVGIDVGTIGVCLEPAVTICCKESNGAVKCIFVDNAYVKMPRKWKVGMEMEISPQDGGGVVDERFGMLEAALKEAIQVFLFPICRIV